MRNNYGFRTHKEYLAAKRKFFEVVGLIDKGLHPEAYRLAWLVPMWPFAREESAEAIANDFVQNVAFWRWYKQQPSPACRNLELMRTIFNAMDEEDK